MLFRNITINPKYLFVNNTASKVRMIHRKVVDVRALRLISDGTGGALHSHLQGVDAHESEVTGFKGRDANDIFEVNLIKPTTSAADAPTTTVNGNLVTYGSAVRFCHRMTGRYLHTRSDKGTVTGLRVSALECTDDDDAASFWIIKPPFGTLHNMHMNDAFLKELSQLILTVASTFEYWLSLMYRPKHVLQYRAPQFEMPVTPNSGSNPLI